MATTYKLGEVCKWSVGNPKGEHRYVDVFISTPGGDTQTVMELPTADAIKLVNAMGDVTDLVNKLHVKSNEWIASMDGFTFPLVAKLLAEAAANGEAFRVGGGMLLKYVELRIDMRSGDWLAKNALGEYAMQEVIGMLAASSVAYRMKEIGDESAEEEAQGFDPNQVPHVSGKWTVAPRAGAMLNSQCWCNPGDPMFSTITMSAVYYWADRKGWTKMNPEEKS